MTSGHPSPSLGPRVHSVWQRTQRNHFAAGLLNFLRWAVPLFLLALTIDWLIDLPSLARLIFLLVIIGLPLIRAWKSSWHQLKGYDPARTALAIEEKEGGLESLLATAIEWEKNGPTPGTSASLWEATRRKAEEAATRLDPARIVSFGNLVRPTLIALALALVILIFALVNGSFLQVGLTRIFNPWALATYPTNTQIDPGLGDLVVKQGVRTSLEFAISGDIPETATLLLQTGEGEPRELELPITDGQCQYLLASASRDFRYRIEAGDARTPWFKVEVIPAPRMESVRVELDFPDYLDREKETLEALTLSVPESTGLRWDLTLDRPVRSAVLHRDDQAPVPLELLDEGTRLVLSEEVEASRGYSFSWVEQDHGFEFASPRFFLQVSSDQPPQVEITSPASNLNALLGRKLDLALRASDDHGIGSARITYRVNLRPAKTVPLAEEIRSGEGEQALNWDYREALPDLKVGDIVSFFIEVTDRYPGPDGPHLARSETRRLTFLSREDYLEQIQRKQDRLLTRVRNVYRQERAAHELVRNLDPRNEEFRQTCQLEAIRQEMLREQLQETAREVQVLLDDLAANNVTDAVEKDALVLVKSGIEAIANQELAEAADLLRQLAGESDGDPRSAAEMVNLAARKLSRLVLLRGIDFAREVFARESHMLAGEQAALRLLTLKDHEFPSPDTLASRHEELARWTNELIIALREGMRYQKRPIAVLQLTRRITDLASGNCFNDLARTAALIRNGQTREATALQNDIVHAFLQAEFSMRSGSEYAAIIDFRKTLAQVRASHEALQGLCQSMTAEDFDTQHPQLANTQATLRDTLVSALLPPVPTPRPRLFDQTLPEPPPVNSLRLAAEKALTEAFLELKKGSQQAAASRQTEATRNLAELDRLLEDSTVELALRTSGLTNLVSNASERVGFLEDFESRQISLLEKTEEAALDEADASPFADLQSLLSEEVSLLVKDLDALSQSQQDLLPLLARLQQLAPFLQEASKSLKENKAEDALGPQEQAADLLAGALEVAQAQVSRLTLLQDLYNFQRAVGNASGWIADLVAEQKDLIETTRTSKKDTAAPLIPRMSNLRQCLVEIAPVLDLVAGRLDVGTPLLFAGTDLEDAILGIEDGDFLDAEDAQTVAAESLAKVRERVSAVESQTGYTAEIVEFLHRAQGEATHLAFRQKEIQNQLVGSPNGIPDGLPAQQEALLKQAETFAQSLSRTTGNPSYSLPASEMTQALNALQSGDRDKATSHTEQATTALASNAEDLFLTITMLHGLPAIEINHTSDPALVLLVEVLALASDQRQLSRITETTGAGDLPKLAARQEKLVANSMKTLVPDDPHPKLLAIQSALAAAAANLKSQSKASVRQAQNQADDLLRQYVIEQALILETAQAPPAPSNEPVLSENETDDLYESTANFVSDFVSGEAPKDKRTEWEVLGNRNRAALNQNFARELPLEYRAILKNYYERVAQ